MQDGVELAERIREVIEGHRFVFNQNELPVTISAGVATRNKNMSQWEELLDEADKAAYKAKNNGRNRVSVI